jgi:hypothetical protein
MLEYLNLPDGHFWHVRFGNPKSGSSEGNRSFFVPTTPEEVKGFADQIAEDRPEHAANLRTAADLPPHQPATPYAQQRYEDGMREAGLGHALKSPPAEQHRTYDEKLKYVFWDRHDFFPKVVGSPAAEVANHLVFADYLTERGDEQLADRIRSEAAKTHLSRVRLGDDHSLHDFVLSAVKSAHPSPTVRALAHPVGDFMHHPDLVDALLHSDSVPDLDAAVWLAGEDRIPPHHLAKDYHKRINTRDFAEQGLEAKVVKGTMYLLDHEDTSHRSYGAPSVIFTAPVADHNEMHQLMQHADGVRRERSEVNEGLGAARMGPAV